MKYLLISNPTKIQSSVSAHFQRKFQSFKKPISILNLKVLIGDRFSINVDN